MTPSKRPPSGSEYPWAAFSETVCDPRAYTTWGPVPPPPSGWSWEGLMLQAIAKARQAPQQGEVPVGALIVDPAGTILAAEHNQPITLSDPSAHAEIMAMRSAGAVLGNYRLEGCILSYA
ncbi:MAG: nucleoside deaminase [Bilophila wadsworthia]